MRYNNKVKYISMLQNKKINRKKNQILKSKILIFGSFLVILIQLLIIVYLLRSVKIKVTKSYRNIQKNIKLEAKHFNEDINKKIKSNQKFFCENEFIFNNTLIEEKIKIVKTNINNKNYDMFVYKTNGYVSKGITDSGAYEFRETKEILSSLFYYSNKRKITKNDIYVLDIGANIGWYTLTLGKEGYNVISFEPSKINYYILLKSYCLNQDINVTIINKGLDNVEKNMTLYHPLDDTGNGVAFDGKDLLNFTNPIKEEITLTKLDYYIEFFQSKNLALIKIDVEGSEGKVIEGGLDLIVKYHIPFIFMEWQSNYLKLKGTDPKLFLKMFESNGYKFSKKDFISKQYISIEDLLKESRINIFVVYDKFLN